jgi:hypothetical protein
MAICEALTILGEVNGSTSKDIWMIASGKHSELNFKQFTIYLKKLCDNNVIFKGKNLRFKMTRDSKVKMAKALAKGKSDLPKAPSRVTMKKDAKKKKETKRKTAKKAAATRKKATKKTKRRGQTKKMPAGQVKKETKKKSQKKKAVALKSKNSRKISEVKDKAAVA